MAVKVEIFARNLELAEKVKDYITKKASKLDRYLNEIEHVRVDLDYIKSARSTKDRNVAQITVRGHRALLRSEERGDDITASFDAAIDKMQRQMEHYKGKHYRGRGNRPAPAAVPAPAPAVDESTEGMEAPVISRRKAFDLIPMSEAEALEQMKLLGHDNFFIFFNVETGGINVLYQRRDGTYGLIEPKVG
jgi:putative sigma-54 modulation protein